MYETFVTRASKLLLTLREKWADVNNNGDGFILFNAGPHKVLNLISSLMFLTRQLNSGAPPVKIVQRDGPKIAPLKAAFQRNRELQLQQMGGEFRQQDHEHIQSLQGNASRLKIGIDDLV